MAWQRREWLAAVLVALFVLLVWLFIEWRMHPPPPPAAVESSPAAKP
jgi:hypothetical protein